MAVENCQSMLVCLSFKLTSKLNGIDGLFDNDVARKHHSHRKGSVSRCNCDYFFEIVVELKRILLSAQLTTPEPRQVSPILRVGD